MARFCTQCGTQNKDEAKFCIGCAVLMHNQAAVLGAEQVEHGADVGAAPSETTGLPSVAAGGAPEGFSSGADAANAQQIGEIRARIEAEDRARAAAFAAAQIRMTVQEAAERAKAERVARKAAGAPMPDSALPGAAPSAYSWDEAPQVGKSMRGAGLALAAVIVLAVGVIWWGQQRNTQNTKAPAASVSTGAAAALGAGANVASTPARSISAQAASAARIPEAANSHAGGEGSHASVQAARVEPTFGAHEHAGTPGEKTHFVRQHTNTHVKAKPRAAEQTLQPDIKAQAPKPRPPSELKPEPNHAQAPTPAPAVAAAGASPSERVQALQQGQAACQDKGNFFTRQVCIQEARWKYCSAPSGGEALWGKVPACPSVTRHHDTP